MTDVTDIELPRDPPAGSSPFGLAMHYGNALMLEMLRRQASPEHVRQGVLWYAAVMVSSQNVSTAAVVEEFRTALERIRAGAQSN